MESVGIDHALSIIRNKLKHLSPQTSPSIYKVPSKLRDVKDKAYEPKMVAIGPYHHGKDKFKTAEELKVRCFQSLLLRKPDVQVEQYISAIAEMEKRVRDCYAERISLNAAEFTVMLVLDGCFVFDVICEDMKLMIVMRRYEAMARFHCDYFNSPWAYVSFFAALVILLLTVAQTLFSALQLHKPN